MRKYLAILILFIVIPTLAQVANSVVFHTISSDGSNKNIANGAVENSSKIQSKLLSATKCKVKSANLLNNIGYSSSIFQYLKTIMDKADPRDLLLMAFVGGWDKNSSTPELSTFSSESNDKVTADYIMNFLLLYPSENGILFMISPYISNFPDLKSQIPIANLDKGGKYIVSFETRDPDFENVLSDLSDCFDNLDDDLTDYLVQKGSIKIHEWIRKLQKKTAEKQINISIYPIIQINAAQMPLGKGR
jgi:hypothetical protein